MKTLDFLTDRGLCKPRLSASIIAHAHATASSDARYDHLDLGGAARRPLFSARDEGFVHGIAIRILEPGFSCKVHKLLIRKRRTHAGAL